MNELVINLENCYGIGKLEHKFDFGKLKSNSFLIYAPNGTMKTSLAKTLEQIGQNDSKSMPCDRVYEDRVPTYSISADASNISPETILVINAENSNYDTSDKISSLIASKDLKKEYEEIYKDLEDRKNEYIRKLKQISQSSDCETEFLEAFRLSPRDTFFEKLLEVSKKLLSKPTSYNFRYNDIFDKKSNVKKFLDKNQSLLSDYIKQYEELLVKSKFFSKSKNSFGTYQASELLKSIDDNSYFDVGHKLMLNNNGEIKSAKELGQLVETEIQNIISDQKLKKSFDRIDKSLGTNAELRLFKSALEKDNPLLVELANYEEFRKKVWLNYISVLSQDTTSLVKFYEGKKTELEKIIRNAKKEFAIWKDIINTFNERFHVPFQVELVNQEDVVLKQATANLQFNYKDVNDKPIQKDKHSLLSILSKGEQRAFYVLQFLFDVESRIQQKQKTLLILDDIADSFDYKNKYAIIEYIKELHQNAIFKILILTHNFDFYRTIAKRLYLDRQCVLMTLKNDAREIFLKQGEYLNDIFSHFKKNLSKPKVFVSIIPLVRNLIIYIEGQPSQNYNQLTSCLHLKTGTDTIKCVDILNVIHSSFPTTSSQIIKFGAKPIKDLIFETADAIEQENPLDEILLENKIALSIAIRLRAEDYMLSKIPNSTQLNIKSNQTTELLKHFKKVNNDKVALSILDEVNLMTPENIHVNAFMYEPIIDISVFHLIYLYKKIKQLS